LIDPRNCDAVAPSQVLARFILTRNASREIMRILLSLLVIESVIGVASATLKPIDADIHPVDNKTVAVYKTTPQGDLRINVYFPPNWKASHRRPTIVFFFAGSCATGSPTQFAATAEYFAARGLVAAAPEYRIESVHHTSPQRCVEDGKSTIRWLRINARHLGIDTRRVIAGGGSSGASMAAFTAYNTAFEPDDEDRSISHEPNALVLLNPAFGCPPGPSSQGAPCAVMASWKVAKGGPPAILFYGTEDPLQDAGRDFARQLISAGTRAEFYTAAGQQHGFFNRLPDSPWHAVVLRQTDLFLASLGYLNGNPIIGIPADTTAALHREPF
jgi:acetyl esterase/lipase